MVDPSKIKKMIMRVYSDPKIYEILTALQNDHAIDCLLSVYLKTNSQTNKYSWGFTKEFIEEVKDKITKTENSFTISDGTFRARMKDLEKKGLVTYTQIDSLKKDYATTIRGNIIAESILNMMHSKALQHHLYSA